MNFHRIAVLVILVASLGALAAPGVVAADADLGSSSSLQFQVQDEDEDDDDEAEFVHPNEREDEDDDAEDVDGSDGSDGSDEVADGFSPGDNTPGIGGGGGDGDAEGEVDGNESAGGGSMGDHARSTLSDNTGIGAIMDPASTAEDVWERAVEIMANVYSFIVDEVVNEALGTPTINNDGAFGIFGTPVAIAEGDQTVSHQEAGIYDAAASETYVVVYEELYIGLIMPIAASVLFFVALMMLIAPSITAITRRRVGSMLASGVFVVMMIVALWEYATLMHGVSDALIHLILPSSEELLDDEVTTYSGPLGLSFAVYLKGSTFGMVLAGIHMMRHIFLFVYPAVLPIFFILAYWGGHRRVKQIGSVFIWQWYGLLFMNVPTAVLLRFAYAVNWEILPFEFLNFLATVMLFVAAVFVPFVMSTTFFVVGFFTRGATAGLASATVSRFTPRPASSYGAGGGKRSPTERLRRGGYGALNRGAAAYERAGSTWNKSRWSRSSRIERNAQTDGGWTPSSRSRRMTDGGSASGGVSPGSRREAAAQRQRTHERQVQRARNQREHYRK
jgi:hypothetical protein